MRLAVHRQDDLVGPNGDGERRLQDAALVEVRVIRPDEMGADRVAVAFDAMHLAADPFRLARRPRGVVGEHPLRAAQVGDAHRRQQHAAELLRREGDRHADDAAEDAVVAQVVPERPALAEQPHVGLTQGDAVLAQAEGPPGRADLHRTELGLIGLEVRREEIVDVVLAGIRPGLEGRPRHRRDRRQRGQQRLEASLLAQRIEVGQLALRQHALGEGVIQSVQPQNDDPLETRPAPALATRRSAASAGGSAR